MSPEQLNRELTELVTRADFSWPKSRRHWHWDRTGIVGVERADTLPSGWRLWLDWLRLVAPNNATEIRALEADSGRHLGYVPVVGRRREEAQLSEPIMSVPTQYQKKPLRRDSE